MATRSVSVTRTIAASPEAIFAVLVDPKKHSLIDGSGTVLGVIGKAPTRLGPNTRFVMAMRLGVPYRMRNRVVEFEEGRLIAWAQLAGVRWRYRLVPDDSGKATTVTETFDWSHSPLGLLIGSSGFPERNRAAMEATLERLERLVVQPQNSAAQH
jgi:uncharacterized protein YndB with AHSA1/START domain